MAGETLPERVPKQPTPQERRVKERAAAMQADEHAPDDPERTARRLLEESDARTDADPAPRNIDDDRVDRRTSDMATAPADTPGASP